MEHQTQRFKICPSVQVNTISSDSDRGMPIFAITIPRDGCPSCVDEGYKLFKNTDKQRYFKTYLHIELMMNTKKK